MATEALPSWQSLLLGLLTDDELAFGYGLPWPVDDGAPCRLPQESELIQIRAGGLRTNRTTGLLEVDLGAGTLRLIALEYDCGEEVTERPLPAGFLEVARQIAWPLR